MICMVCFGTVVTVVCYQTFLRLLNFHKIALVRNEYFTIYLQSLMLGNTRLNQSGHCFYVYVQIIDT